MRVLILAEDCNPDWPSVPAFVYHAARAIAEHADVVLATQIRNGRQIARAGMGNARVVYIDTEPIARPMWKLGVALRGGTEDGWLLADVLGYPSRIAFEWMAERRFRRELHLGEFDLVHRLSPWQGNQPSYMAHLCPVPFLIGPVNDNLPWMESTAGVKRRETTTVERIGVAALPLFRRLPYQRGAYHHAAGILACYDHTIAGLPEATRAKAINFPEVGVDPALFTLPERAERERKTVLFVGRLVPLKGVEVLVHAFAASAILRRHRLRIVGDGSERPRLERLIAEHQLADCVELVGWKAREEVAQIMREADAFAFPSVHEMGGGVVVEAMACGLACVVVDFGGPATLIGPDRGIAVPIGDVPQLTVGFKEALEGLVVRPERMRELGDAAHRHAMTYYTWDARARKTVEVYEWLTGRRAHKPDFWDRAAGPNWQGA